MLSVFDLGQPRPDVRVHADDHGRESAHAHDHGCDDDCHENGRAHDDGAHDHDRDYGRDYDHGHAGDGAADAHDRAAAAGPR